MSRFPIPRFENSFKDMLSKHGEEKQVDMIRRKTISAENAAPKDLDTPPPPRVHFAGGRELLRCTELRDLLGFFLGPGQAWEG